MQQQKGVSNKKVFFSIEELVQELNVKKFLVKSWERDFRLKPEHPAGGTKCYSYENLKIFATIKDLLLNKKMTLSQARRIVSSQLQEPAKEEVIETPAPQPAESSEALQVQPAVQEQVVIEQPAVIQMIEVVQQDRKTEVIELKEEFIAAPVAQEDQVQPATLRHDSDESSKKIETKEEFLQKVYTLKEQLIQFKQLLDLD